MEGPMLFLAFGAAIAHKYVFGAFVRSAQGKTLAAIANFGMKHRRNKSSRLRSFYFSNRTQNVRGIDKETTRGDWRISFRKRMLLPERDSPTFIKQHHTFSS